MNVAKLVGPGNVVPVAGARKFGPPQGVTSSASGNADPLAGGELFRGIAARDAVVPDWTFGLAGRYRSLTNTFRN